jgi:hypothetical protein
VGSGLLIGFGENPSGKRLDPTAGGHRITGADLVGLQFVSRAGGGVARKITGKVSEFVAEKECPGIPFIPVSIHRVRVGIQLEMLSIFAFAPAILFIP